jgi:hypothetical protein
MKAKGQGCSLTKNIMDERWEGDKGKKLEVRGWRMEGRRKKLEVRGLRTENGKRGTENGQRYGGSILLGGVDDARDDLNFSGGLVGLNPRGGFFVACGIDLVVVAPELRYIPPRRGIPGMVEIADIVLGVDFIIAGIGNILRFLHGGEVGFIGLGSA